MLPRFRMTRSGITRAAFGPPRPSARLPLSEVSLICFHSSLSSPSWISDSYFPPFKSLFVPRRRANSTMACEGEKNEKKKNLQRARIHMHARSARTLEAPIIICWRITKLIYSLSPKLSFHFVLKTTIVLFFPHSKPLKNSPPLLDLTAFLHWNVQHVRSWRLSSALSRRSRRSRFKSCNLL